MSTTPEHNVAPEHQAVHDPDEVGTRPTPPKLSRRSLTVYVGMLVTAITALYYAGIWPRTQRAAALSLEVEHVKNALPRVLLTTPKQSPESVVVEMPGDVQAMEQTLIYPRTSGYLKKWHVDIGDRVEAGQFLAEIDAPEVTKELRQAEASLALLRARLETAIAAQKLADLTDQRNRALADGAISKQELDESKAAADSAHTVVAAARADIAVGEANVNRITELDSFSRVVAPFPGTITSRNVDVGQLVAAGNSAGQAMFRLARTNPVRVFVNVPQIYATGVKPGMAATIEARELAGQEFTGQVTRTAGAIDPTTRTLRTEIEVPNESGALLVGSYVQVKLEVRRANPPLLVPASALIFNADGQRLAVIDSENRVHLQPIQVDGDYGTQIGITHGIAAADRIVVNPGDRLSEGIQVAPQ